MKVCDLDLTYLACGTFAVNSFVQTTLVAAVVSSNSGLFNLIRSSAHSCCNPVVFLVLFLRKLCANQSC